MSVAHSQPVEAELHEKSSIQTSGDRISPSANGTVANGASGTEVRREPDVQTGQPASAIMPSSTERLERAGSTTSSKRGAIIQPSSASTSGPAASAPKSQSARKKGGFLSFLSCCGGTNKDEDLDLQEHARPSSTGRPLDVPQDTTIKDDSAAQSSLQDVKDTSVEKANSRPNLETNPVVASDTQNQAQVSEPVTNEKSQQSPIAPENAKGNSPLLQQDSSNEQETHPAKQVMTPALGQSIVADQTLNPESKDVEMTEAPPLEPEPAEVSQATEENKIDTTPQLPPPPPPPVVARRQEPGQVSTQTNGSGDQQKWLLPAVRSEHAGRKCLVLDLDETLVHSSFKVGLTMAFPLYNNLTVFSKRYYTRPTLRYLWRLKVNTTMSM